MEKYLRPEQLEIDPKAPAAEDEWEVWKSKFEAFLHAINPQEDLQKLTLLRAHLSCDCHKFVKSARSYDEAVSLLSSRYVKPRSVIFARHCLASRRQKPGESLDSYLESLNSLAAECGFKDATAETVKSEAIRDTFISGLNSQVMRQRLLENLNLNLEEAAAQARALERAQFQSESYDVTQHSSFAVKNVENSSLTDRSASRCEVPESSEQGTMAVIVKKCNFCGGPSHPRYRCSASNATCFNCGKTGHFSKMCRFKSNSRNQSKKNQSASMDFLSAVASNISYGLKSAVCSVKINGKTEKALVDTGSTKSFMKLDRVRELGLSVRPASGTVCLAATQHHARVLGECTADLLVQGEVFRNFCFAILEDLCAPVLLGHDFMQSFDRVTVKFGGTRQKLDVCGLVPAVVQAPSLFENLRADCRPIQTKSRRRSRDEAAYIKTEWAQGTTALGLNEVHRNSLARYLKFARGQREKRVRTVEAVFEEVSASWLTEVTYTRDELTQILNKLSESVRDEICSELLNADHTASLLLRSLFLQAQQWHLTLETQVDQLEDSELISMIGRFENMEPAETSRNDSVDNGSLSVLPDQSDDVTALQHLKALSEHNTDLTSQLTTANSQIEELSVQREKFSEENAKLKNELKKLQQTHALSQSDSLHSHKQIEQMQEEHDLMERELTSDLQQSESTRSDLQQQLSSSHQQLQQIHSQLQLAEKELERKFQQTAAFRNMKRILEEKNDKLRKLRETLSRYEDANDDDDEVEEED